MTLSAAYVAGKNIQGTHLALVPAIEELRLGALLDGVDAGVVKPGAVPRHDDAVRLKGYQLGLLICPGF